MSFQKSEAGANGSYRFGLSSPVVENNFGFKCRFKIPGNLHWRDFKFPGQLSREKDLLFVAVPRLRILDRSFPLIWAGVLGDGIQRKFESRRLTRRQLFLPDLWLLAAANRDNIGDFYRVGRVVFQLNSFSQNRARLDGPKIVPCGVEGQWRVRLG